MLKPILAPKVEERTSAGSPRSDPPKNLVSGIRSQNGFMERWFGGFKRETGSFACYIDLAALHEAIAMQIYYYNHHRIHSELRMSSAAYAAWLKDRDKAFVEGGG